MNPVTDSSKQISVNASFKHVFVNPHGIMFEIGCFSSANGCLLSSLPSDEFSWFPGYQWQIAECVQCGGHLGWLFVSRTDRFFGLILEHLAFE